MTSIRAAATVLTTLLSAGVTDVVLCPGSRSAPFAYALHELEMAGAITLHVETDERVAGFLALGLGKASGRPAAVITTSGSAVANLHPAAVEAFHSAIPFIALTADRPEWMRGTGANQTTNQVGLLGPSLVAQVGLSAQDALQSGSLTEVLSQVWRGPVHINIGLDTPLHPNSTIFTTTPKVGTWVEPTGSGTPETLDDRPTVIVAGPGTPYAELLQRTGLGEVPILAEPATTERHHPGAIPAARVVAPHFDDEIERVIIVGHPTLSRPLTQLMSRRDIEIIAVASDPVPTDPGRVARVVNTMPTLAPQTEWLRAWQDAGHAAHRAGREALGDELDALGASAVIADAEGHWFLGASNIIRDIDLLVGKPAATFHASRGLAGIDGTISTARGMAHVLGGMRVALGDLTFIHDLGGLVITKGEERPPLDIVVIDDSGGGIFATLEHGDPRFEPAFDRVFRTAKNIDIVRVAEACGWEGHDVTSRDHLTDLLSEKPQGRLIRIGCERHVNDVRNRREILTKAMNWAIVDLRS